MCVYVCISYIHIYIYIYICMYTYTHILYIYNTNCMCVCVSVVLYKSADVVSQPQSTGFFATGGPAAVATHCRRA